MEKANIDLVTAMRLDAHPCLALVGSGGKTTTLFHLARQLGKTAAQPVLITTTTHLGVHQAEWADEHHVIADPSGLQFLSGPVSAGVILLTGPEREDERLGGLDGDLLDRLHDIAIAQGYSLLIEADGSRQLPIKAPAAHEPVLPVWIDTVVVTTGLSGLGQPLGPEHVHRPEIFARLSGLEPGAPITPAALAQVLTHRDGGLKGIPSRARRICLLNQADTEEHRKKALEMVPHLLETYSSVITASLRSGPETSQDGLTTHPGRVFAVHERIAGVVLAAGGSLRLGQPKQLLAWQDERLVHRAARIGLEAGLSPVVVVTGAQQAEVQAAVQDLPVQVVYNPVWGTGQGSSVAAGVAALPPGVGGVVFLLVDQPFVTAGLIHSLVALHAQFPGGLIAPQVAGKRANPVLFDRQTFSELTALSGDEGGRGLFQRYPVQWLAWNDPNLPEDIDTLQDYTSLLNQLNESRG